MKKRGFTLIELMVVIAIIGILAAVIVASINSARAKARNTQRTSDINQLVNAFNLGFSSSGSMPGSGGWWCVSETCYDGFSAYSRSAAVDSFLSPYIQFPKDPTGGSRGYGGYLYYKDMPATPSVSDPSYTFETGSYLLWLLEPPLTSTSCSHGHLYYATANYVECFVKIN